MEAGKKWLFFEWILLASRGLDSDYSKGHCSCNDSNSASLLFAVSEGRGSSSTINYNIIPTAAVL